AGAWLGAAEAPTKLVKAGVSPIVVSLLMVIGVFLARWSLPALIRGTGQIRLDVREAPHLIIWGVLAGCLWAVANTMTIFAIRDIGLSIAFPLWNINSLLGIFWGFVLFNELRDAGRLRWVSVIGGAALMFAGAALLALASSGQMETEHSTRGILAALCAGILWGILVFGELQGRGSSLYAQVIGGSLLMAAGAAAIALSAVTRREHARWHEAAQRESHRYGVDANYVQAGLEGKFQQGVESQ